jgi:hypothetical protein
MKQIELTKGKYALVDEKYYDKLNEFSWYPHTAGYAATKISTKTILIHRLIAEWEWGPSAKWVDHRNGDVLNNCVANLRYASQSDNMMNRGPNCNNTSGYKGVTWCKDRCKWRAQLEYKGKSYYLGYFNSKLDAAKAHNNKVLELAGEFAWLNPV